MVKLFRQRKGQSAIEYLTTYGWMLLVIAIVGGAIFTTVQNSAQLQSTSGLANADVQIENFGVSGDNLKVELRAAAQNQVENINIKLYQQNVDVPPANSSPASITIPVGQTETVTFDNVTRSENTNTFTVHITYDVGGLTNLAVNGTMTGRLTQVP